MSQTVTDEELRVGDTIEVWWSSVQIQMGGKPNQDIITRIEPYTGPLACFKGGHIAYFAYLCCGMTLEPGGRYQRTEQGKSDEC